MGDLYKNGLMPEDLIRAHKSLNNEARNAYGKKWRTKDSCLKYLVQLYYDKNKN